MAGDFHSDFLNRRFDLRVRQELDELMDRAGFPPWCGSDPADNLVQPAVQRLKAGFSDGVLDPLVVVDLVQAAIQRDREVLGAVPSLGSQLAGILIELASSTHEDARQAAIELIVAELPEERRALLDNLVGELFHESEVARRFAVRSIRLFDVDLASGKVDEIARVLEDPVPSVVLEALSTLQWLGPDAAGVVPALIACIKANSPDSEGRAIVHEAAKALARLTVDDFDPVCLVADAALRTTLIDALRELGPEGRELRKSIESATNQQGEGFRTWASLAKKLGICTKTLRRHIQKAGITLRKVDGYYRPSPVQMQILGLPQRKGRK